MPFWEFAFFGLFRPRSGPGRSYSFNPSGVDRSPRIPMPQSHVEIVRIIPFVQQLIHVNKRKLKFPSHYEFFR